MSQFEKLLEKARNHPGGLTFDEFRTLLARSSWVEDRQAGSHQIWYSPKKHRISIQNKQGKAKGYQVKQFLLQYGQEKSS